MFDDGAPGVDDLRKVYGGGCDDTMLRKVWKQHKQYCAAYEALPVKSRSKGRDELGQDVPALGLRTHLKQSPFDFWMHTAKVVHKWDDLAAHALCTLEARGRGGFASPPHPFPRPQTHPTPHLPCFQFAFSALSVERVFGIMRASDTSLRASRKEPAFVRELMFQADRAFMATLLEKKIAAYTRLTGRMG